MALRVVMMRGGVAAACAAALAAAGAPAAWAGIPILNSAQVPHRATPLRSSHPFLPRDTAAYRAAKRQAGFEAGLAGPLAAPGIAGPAAAAAVTSPTVNQPGLTASDNEARNNGTPPDPTGAVGPSDYVEFVNSVVRVYQKDLTAVSSTAQLDTFVGKTNDAVFDPQIQYDPVADRWFYLADDCTVADCSTSSFLAFGWSKTSDPSDLVNGWCRYFVRDDNGTNGFFDDYPKLGHNDTHLVFGTNVFNTTSFVSSRIWTVPKPAAGAITTCPGSPGTAHYFSGSAASPVEDGNLAAKPLRTSDGDFAFTPVPANTQDSSANAYVVAADSPSPTTASQVMMWHVSGAAGSEALTADGNVNVSSYATPANVPQPGTSDVLDSSDTRLTQAVAHVDGDAGAGEAIWTQHTIAGAGGRSQVRWYELLPGSSSPRQQGNIASTSDFIFNGAISPSMAGNEAAIQYNAGSASQLTQIRASSRSAGQALGTMGGELLLGTSSAADQDFSCPSNDATASSCRWGDYAGASPDPAAGAGHLVWGTNQLIASPAADNPAWTTRNFALDARAAPSAAFTASPNPGFTGQPVSFDASASTPSAGITDYAWDLDGNGTFETDTGTVDHVSHSYAQPATVTVGLRVSEGAATSSTTQVVTIKSSAPTAAFTASPASTTRGVAVGFDASASSDAEAPGGIATYAWDFNGDGSVDQTTASPTTSHSFAALGTFAVRLVVTDADDHQASAPVTHAVTVQNAAPVAALTFAPGAPRAGQPVTFSAAGSSDPDGAITDYRWDLNGDGVFETDTGAQPQAVHTYSLPAQVPVAVQVRDADGGSATSGVTVPVGAAAPARPRLTLRFARSVRLANLIRRGLNGSLSCREPCSVSLSVRIPARLARQLHLPRVIARARVRARGSGFTRVRVLVTRKAKRNPRLSKRFTVALSARATDAAGQAASAKRAITVAR